MLALRTIRLERERSVKAERENEMLRAERMNYDERDGYKQALDIARKQTTLYQSLARELAEALEASSCRCVARRDFNSTGVEVIKCPRCTTLFAYHQAVEKETA